MKPWTTVSKEDQPKSREEGHIQNKKLIAIANVIKPYLRKGKTEKKIAVFCINELKKIDLREAQRARSVRVIETLEKIQLQDGKLSVNDFWKLKKSSGSKYNEKTSVIDKNGVEIFDDNAILNEYVKEFEARLSHRIIDEDLRTYQETTTKLMEKYLEIARKNKAPDFLPKETKQAMSSLMSGKSPGADMFPPEIMHNPSDYLVNAINNTLNNIKNGAQIPLSWVNVIVVTIFKNKGTKRKLK